MNKTMKALVGRLSKMKKRRKNPVADKKQETPKRKYDPRKKFNWEDDDIIIEKAKN